MVKMTPEFQVAIKQLLFDRRWTASEMADEVGVSQSCISNWLAGKGKTLTSYTYRKVEPYLSPYLNPQQPDLNLKGRVTIGIQVNGRDTPIVDCSIKNGVLILQADYEIEESDLVGVMDYIKDKKNGKAGQDCDYVGG